MLCSLSSTMSFQISSYTRQRVSYKIETLIYGQGAWTGWWIKQWSTV